MNALVGIKQTRNRILKQYTVGDIVPADDWSLEQSLDTAWNRAKIMDSLERLDRRKERLVKDALKGGE
ncbi:tRNA (guanine-N1)-methyltransferase [Ligilactobacillus ruminis]|uniref:tRNA (guanine-N1)-methyltransferase n=1 Tax=Ligilactobacillus ruminis TaxID=1623 RepID=UPI003F94EFAC